MAKLKIGTTQASHYDIYNGFVIEQWNGTRWVLHPKPVYQTKKAADIYGFANFPDHKK